MIELLLLPNEENITMTRSRRTITFFSILLLAVSLGWTQEPIRMEFSGVTAEENGVTITGAGFGSISQAQVFFGGIPTDHVFEGATDGIGAIIVCQATIILSPPVASSINVTIVMTHQ